MITEPKKLFLADGLGAIVSAFFLGVILAKYEPSFGMPKTVLYFLASIACLFAVYSLGCLFLVTKNFQPYLKGIALANLSYCCITIALVLYFSQKLTILGWTYFILELIVLVFLARLEGKTIARLNDKRRIANENL